MQCIHPCLLWAKSRHRLAWNVRQSRECGTVVSKHSQQLHATRMRHGRPGGIGSRCWRLRQRLFAGSIALHPRGCGQSMGEPRTSGRGSFIWRLPTKADMCAAATSCLLCAKSGHWCYSITSSARASTDGGIVRPCAFAVLRLITSSYLVGACTGISAGVSPFRMRST